MKRHLNIASLFGCWLNKKFLLVLRTEEQRERYTHHPIDEEKQSKVGSYCQTRRHKYYDMGMLHLQNVSSPVLF